MACEFFTRISIPDFETPEHFIPLFRETNVFLLFDPYCFRAAAASARGMEAGVRAHRNVFPSTRVKIPASYFLDALPEGRPRASFALEPSAQQIVGDPASLWPAVRELKRGGVKRVLEDVGFGFTCLEALLLFEPDFLKFDRRWVAALLFDAHHVRFAERAVKAARALGAEVMAEGIETAEQRDVRARLGVAYGQGFLWGHV